MCGEPFMYETYHPKSGEFADLRSGSVKRRSVEFAKVRSENGERDLLLKIRRFCAVYSMPYSAFGRKILGDSNLVYRLMNGAIPRDATIKKINEAMKEYEKGNGFVAV